MANASNDSSEVVVATAPSSELAEQIRDAIRASIRKVWILVFSPHGQNTGWQVAVMNEWQGKLPSSDLKLCYKIAESIVGKTDREEPSSSLFETHSEYLATTPATT